MRYLITFEGYNDDGDTIYESYVASGTYIDIAIDDAIEQAENKTGHKYWNSDIVSIIRI